MTHAHFSSNLLGYCTFSFFLPFFFIPLVIFTEEVPARRREQMAVYQASCRMNILEESRLFCNSFLIPGEL
jgi:hypothetical protein